MGHPFFIRRYKIGLLLKILVSSILLYIIFKFISIGKIYGHLLSANLYYIVAAMLLLPLYNFFRAVKWNSLTGIFNKSIGVWPAMEYTFISHAFAIATPGRLGEFIKVKYLREKANIGYVKSLATVLEDKLFDVLSSLLLIFFGLAFSGIIEYPKSIMLLLLISYSAALAPLSIYFNKLLGMFSRLIPKKLASELLEGKMTNGIYAKTLFFSVIAWAVLSLQAFIVLRSLGAQLPFYAIMAIIPLIALVSMIPISIGGLGIREIAAIYFFAKLGITPEKAVAFSLLYTFVTLGLSAAIGVFFYMRRIYRKNQISS